MYEVKRRKPGRHWFALLTCLLLLSLAAPTLWDDGTNPFGFEAPSASVRGVGPSYGESFHDAINPQTVEVQRPITIMTASTKVEVAPESVTGGAIDPFATTPVAAVESPVEPAVADLAQIDPPTVLPSPLPVSLPRIEIDAVERRGLTNDNRGNTNNSDPSLDPAPSMSRADGWPLPMVLLEQLDALSEHSTLRPWAFEVISLIEQLNEISLIDNVSADRLLSRLDAAVARSGELAEEIESPSAQSDMRRAAYAVSRRVTTWKLANRVFTQDVLAAADGLKPGHDRLAMLLLGTAEPNALLGPIDPGKPLLRIDSQPLILEAEPDQGDLSPPLVPFALNGMDRVKNLLVTLERYEATCLPTDSHRIARHIDDLASSPDVTRQALAKHLDNHYRNANLRINVTKRLSDQLLPKLQPQEGEVDDYVNGVPVWGWQETIAQLRTNFVEDASQIRLRVAAKGNVTSDTEANSGPATLYSFGQTDYLVWRELIISPRGLAMTPTRARADAYSSLTGVDTDYDGLLLFGPLAEKVARKKYNEQKWQAMAEVEERVAGEARERFEKEFTPKIIAAAHKFHTQVWTPLLGLELDPTAVEMRTTPQRLVTRFRLGAADQLAAHTARPRAPSDSLASMQIHESLLNNALDQFQLNGKTFTLPELHRHMTARLDAPATEVPEDFDKRVKISFAKEDAVRVRCDKGAVELTLSLAEISRGKKHHWSNLIVKARYEPEGTGLKANLVRQESIRLIGDELRTRDQVALRGVFSKLLSRSRYAVLVPDHIATHQALGQLEVIQFLVNDGWIAVAIGPRLSASGDSEESTARVPRWRVGQKDRDEVMR